MTIEERPEFLSKGERIEILETKVTRLIKIVEQMSENQDTIVHNLEQIAKLL